MNRKSNPWVALIALILLALMLCAFTGRELTTESTGTEAPSINRFEIERVHYEMLGYTDTSMYILTDTETGVQYLFVRVSDGGGLTVLQPAPEKEVE